MPMTLAKNVDAAERIILWARIRLPDAKTNVTSSWDGSSSAAIQSEANIEGFASISGGFSESDRGRFKNTYELLNLRVLNIPMRIKYTSFNVWVRRYCLTHTLKDTICINRWKFKSCQIWEFICVLTRPIGWLHPKCIQFLCVLSVVCVCVCVTNVVGDKCGYLPDKQ